MEREIVRFFISDDEVEWQVPDDCEHFVLFAEQAPVLVAFTPGGTRNGRCFTIYPEQGGHEEWDHSWARRKLYFHRPVGHDGYYPQVVIRLTHGKLTE
jgi:hypothetical protein